jgi:hypothetical protein
MTLYVMEIGDRTYTFSLSWLCLTRGPARIEVLGIEHCLVFELEPTT